MNCVSLKGKKVVLAASRKLEEMSLLVEKQGGVPVVRSLQGTVLLAGDEVELGLRKLITEGADVFIFTTGIGFDTLVNISEKLGVKNQFLQTIEKSDVAARGYKTVAALKKIGVNPLAVDEDGTTAGLIRALNDYDFEGKKVVVQLHGDRVPKLIEFLQCKGAIVEQILPYQHIAPNTETVEMLCKEIIALEVQAVCFTTAIQVRSLFDFAKRNNFKEGIDRAFQQDVLAVAVGKVTAEALREEGVVNYIAPQLERMGAMIIELSQHFKEGKYERSNT
ncbi:uroporphyrinogen-III synthase [Anaerobacillus arseniciselenatis]|uniref:Uroporphyrinogen-III synthase n=1 Tax=Anaerobacillus arseniciselenatis TaxID=85682 RepID=A0A1S2LSW7_9BACI|nr:uroporphyrinogen-III synthase [Anaerobacillus arseniciselenatis]OIJ15608.1 uroporphyrinogen-III synthase [Anaerobacillus arseniciselenatis]